MSKPPALARHPTEAACFETGGWPERIHAVLDAIYAAYGEGWTDSAGERRALAEEAIWLARVLAHNAPAEPEALGLLALMLHLEARRPARRDADGRYVPLAEQDCALWNDAAIDEAERLLLRAAPMGQIGRYQLEAAIQSAHAARAFTRRTDWTAILTLYDALIALTGPPVARLNRIAALAQAQGAPAALAELDALAEVLAEYQPFWALRAHLLAKSGSALEARDYWGAYTAYGQALGAAGVAAGGAGLLGPTAATTVRVRGGARQVTDGPYADTKEQLGGFFLIEAPDLDAALDWAAKCPAARGSAEVRPVMAM